MRATMRIAALLAALLCTGAGMISEAEYAKLRTEARERPRRVVFNNDGCDVLYFPRHLDVTRENFLAQRTSWLAGICDTLVYCPVSAGQGHFTLELPGADFLSADPPRRECRNIAAELRDRGEDYFQWLIDFCRENDMEIFFSFRFNDTHDVGHRPNKPHFLFCKWKDEHRQFLFGADHTQSPRNGWWSALEFSHPEVRDRQLELVKAVLDKYDVDGIDLDFSRYPRIFRSTASGTPASPEELEMINDLMRKIRAAIDAKGREISRGLLLSVVLPDSMEMCRNLGYDVDTWMREGLVDIIQQTDGFRINPISDIAENAHRYGVKYYAFNGSPWPYASLENGSILLRRAASAYAARAHTAMTRGADGLYLYNITEAGEFKRAAATDVEQLATVPFRRYFITDFAWEIPRGYSFSPAEYQHYGQLTAHVKCNIVPGTEKKFPLELGDAPAGNARVVAYIDRTAGTPGALHISSNGIEWPRTGIVGRYESFTVPEGALKAGNNEILLTASSAKGENMVVFVPEKLKDFETGFFGSAAVAALSKKDDATFAVAGNHGLAGLVKRFGNTEFSSIQFAFSAKIVDGAIACSRFANAGYAMTVKLFPDKLTIPDAGFEMSLDTGNPHDYSVTMTGAEFILAVDGRECFRTSATPSGYTPAANAEIPESSRLYSGSTSLMLGIAAGSPGAVEYRNIQVENPPGTVELSNLMVEIDKPETAPEIPDDQWRPAPLPTGGRALDGRVYPFPAIAPGDDVAAEIALKPGDRRTVWVVSNGKRVSAWVITREGVRAWPDSPTRIDLNPDGEVVRYRLVMGENDETLYRNGALFYRTLPDGKMVYDRGVHSSVPEAPTPEEFLKAHARMFTIPEQEVISSGGTFARGLHDKNDLPSGWLTDLRFYEGK